MRRSLTPGLLLLAVLTSSQALPGEGSPHPLLLVVNQADHTLSFVDPLSGQLPTAVDLGGVTGHEVAVSPDSRMAFVPIYGNSGVGKPGTDGGTLKVIDLASRKIAATVDFGHGVRPHLPVYDAKRDLLYVTTELDQTVSILDPHTLKIVGSIPTGQPESHMLALSHDGRFGYTANVGPGTVSVLDLESRRTVAVIPISGQTQRISVSNDDRLVFTADQTAPRLAVIDTASNNLASWIALPAVAYGTASTPDGRWLLAVLRPLHQVAVIDLQTLKVVRSVDVPATPTEVLIPSDGKNAYVSCGGTVASIDLSTWKVTATLQAGRGADGLAWVR